jgi:hypothetical protein
LHLRDHGLRDGLDLRHKFGANVKEVAIIGDGSSYHLAQVMARTEDFAGRGNDDDAELRVDGEFVQAANKFKHQIERERVAAVWAIERDYAVLAVDGSDEVLVGH